MRFSILWTAAWSASLIVPSAAQENRDEPPAEVILFGDNLEDSHVFVELAGRDVIDPWRWENGILRANGKGKGYIRTQKVYADYKLRLEWRWPEAAGNSGVLVNIVGDDQLWPKSFECQLKSGAAGDFATFMDARSKEEVLGRNPQGVSTGRLPRSGTSQENPPGEWNVYEIIVAGDSITLAVNGVEVNRMTGCLPSAGMIALQSEGTPIDFRNITLTPLPPAKDMYAPLPE